MFESNHSNALVGTIPSNPSNVLHCGERAPENSVYYGWVFGPYTVNRWLLSGLGKFLKINHIFERDKSGFWCQHRQKKKIEGTLYLLRSLALFCFASPVQPLVSGEKSESCFWEHNCYKEEEIWNSREWRGPLGLLQWTQEVARVWELQRSHLAIGKPSADISEQLGCLAPPQVIMTSVSSVSISEAVWPLPTPQNSQEQVRLWDVYLI